MAKQPKQTEAGRRFADYVFVVAVSRGDWQQDQRAEFDHANRGMGWWWVGQDDAPGWEERWPYLRR